MFHMKQIIDTADNIFVRCVKKKSHLFSIIKYNFHYTPALIAKLKPMLQLKKNQSRNTKIFSAEEIRVKLTASAIVSHETSANQQVNVLYTETLVNGQIDAISNHPGAGANLRVDTAGRDKEP